MHTHRSGRKKGRKKGRRRGEKEWREDGGEGREENEPSMCTHRHTNTYCIVLL